MSRDTFNYTHGDTGSSPSSSLDFSANERPDANIFDWYWYNVIEAIKGHAAEFDELDSDNDGVVDEADTLASGGNLKGDLNALNGETIWDESAGYILQSVLQNDSLDVTAGTGLTGGGTISLGGAATLDIDTTMMATRTWVNNNADVPNADYADSAGDADTLDGNHASHFTTLTEVNNNADVPNADYADNSGDADTVDGNHASELGMAMGKMDSAETFTESDVTTQLNNTTISGGSVNLNEAFSSTPDYPYYVNDGSAPNDGGWVINPDMPITTMDIGVNITSTTDGTFKVIRLSDNTTLVSQSFTNENVSRVTFGSPLQTGTDYAIVVAPNGHGGNGERYDEQPTDTGAYTASSGYADGSQPTSGWYINNIDVGVYNTSGTISVEWPSSTDIYSWDRATFQHTPNGGSVEVYVEESTDGGATWTEVAGPISRGDPIPSSADAEVRLRADLSRPSTSDTTPTLDSIYRRYEV